MIERLILTNKQEIKTILATNKIIKNTYILLSLTILFSAFTSYIGFLIKAKSINFFIFLIIYISLYYMINKYKNSYLGIVFVFLFTGFLGYFISPMINSIIMNLSNGQQIISLSLGITGIIFVFLSGYALITKKNFNFMISFLSIGVTLTFITIIVNYFLNIPLIYLIISSAIIIISSGYILYETNNIINGGETNYVIATIGLYLNIFNIFINLLHIFEFMLGEKE